MIHLLKRMSTNLKQSMRFFIYSRLEILSLYLLIKGKRKRTKSFVMREYEERWNQDKERIGKLQNLDEFLALVGNAELPQYLFIEGKRQLRQLNIIEHYASVIAECLLKHFPHAESITEYGCGVGQNLLYLKRRFPNLKCYGYELCSTGVEVGRLAAKKFGLEVHFAELDYVAGPPNQYVFPVSDLAFTILSLEQLPHSVDVAIKNIQSHCRLGTMHIEPVVEQFPSNYFGFFARIYHRQLDYLQNFEKSCAKSPFQLQEKGLLNCHAATSFPSLYVFQNPNPISRQSQLLTP